MCETFVVASILSPQVFAHTVIRPRILRFFDDRSHSVGWVAIIADSACASTSAGTVVGFFVLGNAVCPIRSVRNVFGAVCVRRFGRERMFSNPGVALVNPGRVVFQLKDRVGVSGHFLLLSHFYCVLVTFPLRYRTTIQRTRW